MPIGGDDGFVGRLNVSHTSASASASSAYSAGAMNDLNAERFDPKAYINLWTSKPTVTETEAIRDHMDFVRTVKVMASLRKDDKGKVKPMPSALGALIQDDNAFTTRMDDYAEFFMEPKVEKKLQEAMATEDPEMTMDRFRELPVMSQMRYAAKILHAGDHDVTDNKIDAQLARITTRAMDLREQSAYFGTPDRGMGPINKFDFTGNHSQQPLLSAYAGPNKSMTGWLILEVAIESTWYTKYALPLRRDDNIAGTESELLVFNPSMLDRVPILATSSYVTSRSLRYRSMPVRFGKSAEMEWTFSRTPRGRLIWMMQQVQIRNATITTIVFGIATALMTCKGTVGIKSLNYGRNTGVMGGEAKLQYDTRYKYEAALTKEQTRWDRMNRHPSPANEIVDDACTEIQNQCNQFSGGENVTRQKNRIVASFTRGTPKLALQSAALNAPEVTGRPRNFDYEMFKGELVGDDTVLMPGGWRAAESRAFRTQGGDYVDPQKSTQVIGHFAYTNGGVDRLNDPYSMVLKNIAGPAAPGRGIADEAVNPLAAGAAAYRNANDAQQYQTSQCDVRVYRAQTDTLKNYTFDELVRTNQIYQSSALNRGGIDQPGRMLTWLGVAVMLGGRHMRTSTMRAHDARGVRNGDFCLEADYYPVANMTSEEKLARDKNPSIYSQRSLARIHKAHGHPNGDLGEEKIMTAYEFWGPEKSEIMARYIELRSASPGVAETFLRCPRKDRGVSNPPAGGVATMTWVDWLNLMKHFTMKYSNFMDACLDFNVPIFSRHYIFTPFSQYVTNAAVIWRSGSTELATIDGAVEGIGDTQYALPSYMISLDAQVGHYNANFHIYLRSMVKHPQYVYIDKFTYVEKHLRGDNGQLFTVDDQRSFAGNGSSLSGHDAYLDVCALWKSDPAARDKSDFSIFVPPNAILPEDNHMDITGGYSPDAVNSDGVLHYPTAEFYRAWWSFKSVQSVGRQDPDFSIENGNSIISRKYHEQTSIGRDGRVRRIRRRDCGHWGMRLGPHYIATRSDPLVNPITRNENPDILDE